MHCLYCKKRLWLFFSKERVFCSKLHETAYHEELSAMNRLREFTVPVERPAISAPRNRKLSEIYRASETPAIPPSVVPSLCGFVGELRRPKSVTPDPAANAAVLEAKPFAGSIQFPLSSRSLIPLSLTSATEPAGEIATIANDPVAGCRVKSIHSRRIPPRTPTAFSLRTHRRRVR